MMSDASLAVRSTDGAVRLTLTCASGEGDALDFYYDGVSVGVTMQMSAQTRCEGGQPMVMINPDMVRRLALMLPTILDRTEPT